jgi:hypothetical protein
VRDLLVNLLASVVAGVTVWLAQRVSVAHLRALLPGVEFALSNTDFTIGTNTFHREPERMEYVVVARAWGPSGGRPVFVLGGQTARTNLAAARFLAARYRELDRRYGASQRFCLVLRIVEPAVYGADFAEIVADVSDEAFVAP